MALNLTLCFVTTAFKQDLQNTVPNVDIFPTPKGIKIRFNILLYEITIKQDLTFCKQFKEELSYLLRYLQNRDLFKLLQYVTK